MGSVEQENYIYIGADNFNRKEKETECLKKLQQQIQENAKFNDLEEFLDERFLLHFVRGKNCDATRAYETLENYVHMRRTKHRGFFKSLSARDIGMNNGMLRVLKRRDHIGRLIVLDRGRLWDPSKVSMEEAYKQFLLYSEEIWNFEEAELNGVVGIFDFADWSFQQAKAVSPRDIINGYSLIGQSSMPLKYKNVHFVNEPLLFSIVLKVVKSVLPKKLGDRMHFHATNLKSLHDEISPDVLPESLGGSVPDVDAFDDDFEQRIRDKEDYYRRFMEKL